MNSGKGLALGMSKMKSPAARTGVWGLSKKMIKMNHLPAKTWNSLRGRGGFSLIELLVVIAVLGILAAILVGGIQKTLTKSKLISSGSNLRQLASAVHLYNSENNGKYPMLRGSSAAGESWVGPFWPDQIRPFLQMEPGEKGSALHCPLEENHHPTMSDYGNNPFVIRNDFNKGPVRGVNITNPTGIILFVMTRDTVKERGEWFLPQSYPASPSAATLRPHDRGSGKIMAVFVDGHLEEFTPEEMDRRAVELFLPTL
jgi:prepilin-type N-terminal cleavage/methylation domain-containing protein